MSCRQITVCFITLKVGYVTSAWFNINWVCVKQFNEDNFKDDDPVSSPTTGGPGVSESEIGNLLSKNQLAEALIACLNNFGTTGVKNQAEKVSFLSILQRRLS